MRGVLCLGPSDTACRHVGSLDSGLCGVGIECGGDWCVCACARVCACVLPLCKVEMEQEIVFLQS